MNILQERFNQMPESKKAKVVSILKTYDPNAVGCVVFVSQNDIHDRVTAANPCPVRMVYYTQHENALNEIERLRRLLSACRGSVKTDLNTYERMVLERKKAMEHRTVTDDAVEDEAQHLFELLEQIDALTLTPPNSGCNKPPRTQD